MRRKSDLPEKNVQTDQLSPKLISTLTQCAPRIIHASHELKQVTKACYTVLHTLEFEFHHVYQKGSFAEIGKRYSEDMQA